MKPVLFLPGFPASELHDMQTGATVYSPSLSTLLDPERKKRFLDAMVDVLGDLIAGPPIATLAGIAKEAQSLYDILTHQYGYDTTGLDPAQFAAAEGASRGVSTKRRQSSGSPWQESRAARSPFLCCRSR